ncbi:MAG: DUF6569 family protein [Halioglobus sp.]
MTAINKALQAVTLGEAQSFANLQITPLLAPAPGNADYLTLSEAQALGLAVVTEVSESGSVPTLLLENSADQAVFLLDGEELVGAKQNRILNLTLLVPAKTKLEIPVSCVEQGRWSHLSPEFAAAERTFFSKGRARKAKSVSANLRESGRRNANQGEVWNDISEKMDSMNVGSRTHAIADAYEHFAVNVDEYVDAFSTGETQVGACFAINGRIRGVELFDVSDTCKKLMPKLIRSYALDAIEERQEEAPSGAQSIMDFIQAVAAAPADSFKALGEGRTCVSSQTALPAAHWRLATTWCTCARSARGCGRCFRSPPRMRRASTRQHSRTGRVTRPDSRTVWMAWKAPDECDYREPQGDAHEIGSDHGGAHRAAGPLRGG